MKKPRVAALGLLILTVALTPLTASAGGVVSGVVIDGFTGQPVRGATITFEDTDVALSTDMAGAFRSDIQAGAFSVLISHKGYESQKVLEVVVLDGEVADFAVVLLPNAGSAGITAEGGTGGDAAFSGEITIVADVATSTEAALLAERKSAAGITDLIGKEEISKATGSNAAGVLQRVTGISLQDDKYVYVRGLGERYSSTSLNGSRLPTTEFDKKVVPLDLFPSKLLDKVEVSKTFTPDMHGDFVAGLVELSTLDFPEGSSFDLSIGAASDSNTTGELFGRYMGGLSSSGNGGQTLPATIPDERLVRSNPFLPGQGFTPKELQAFGGEFIGEWTPQGTDTFYPNSEFSNAGLGNNFALNYGATLGRFGVVLSGTHVRGFDHRDENQRYFALGDENGLQLQNDYDLNYDTENVRRGMVGAFSYRIGNNNTIQLRTLISDDSSSESRFQTGYNDDQSTDIREYRVRYQDEEMTSYQLSGEHFLESIGEGTLLEWRGTVSDASNSENLRSNFYKHENNDYFLQQESQSAFLLYNDLADDMTDGAIDWTQFLTGGAAYGNIKVGMAYTNRDRDFGSRRFRYQFRGVSGIDLTLLPDDILIEENITPTTFEIREDTRATDTYTASHSVGGAYIMGDVTTGKWRFVGGLRFEDSDIEVETFDPFSPDAPSILSTVQDQDFMPALGVTCRIGDATNFRAAFSQTVNRPEFRELAPFEFTDVVGGRSARGNPDLTSATIRSYDVRWEWFPSDYGVVAASLFYKKFDNPIERTLLIAVELQSTWQNVDSARNLGAELEFRRTLGFVSEKLEPLTLQLNYTWVDSQIDVGVDDPIVTNTTRALVGQPDHTANAMLDWVHPSWGSAARILVNYSGEKIVEAGAFGLPDVVAQPFTSLDFVWQQDLGFLADGLGLKLALTNITNEDRELSGGRTQLYSEGRRIGLSISYSAF
ncbi:MAG: outer membrane beta-barrel protein [Thermoanaerobaculales bacterium]|nr:outer membrane beta-barrel protein [Thermoanaerobaculales bacterium]